MKIKISGIYKVMANEKKRLAILNDEKCKPKKCNLECKKVCPINAQGKICI